MENEIIDKEDIENTKDTQYLGTFRWKKLHFSELSELGFEDIYNNYENILSIDSYSKLFEVRVTKKLSEVIKNKETKLDSNTNSSSNNSNSFIHPSMIDALSYPYSIISIIRKFLSLKKLDLETIIKFALSNINKASFNVILIGAAERTEERIAKNSKYYHEIYYYFFSEIINHVKQTLNYKNDNELISYLKKIYDNLKINIVFTGEEISTHTGLINLNIVNYSFFALKTLPFFQENLFEFNKENTVIIGMNCGFGAGYEKLTLSWIKDLQLLLKMKFLLGFTYTNDYEDYKGEILIMNHLTAKILTEQNEQNFKSMSIYQSNETTSDSNENEKDNNWSCGNYGYYLVQGSRVNKKILDEDIITILKNNNLYKSK